MPFNTVVKSIFSSSYVFIFILLGILAMFLAPNVDTMISAMGFETKSNLRQALNMTKADLDNVAELNTKNAKALEAERLINAQMRAEIANVTQKKTNAQAAVSKVKEKKAIADAPIVQKLIAKTVTTSETITLPLEELNTLSTSNIEQVHDVFKTLFPST